MSDKKDKPDYEDPDLERFVRENREMVKKLLELEKDLAKETLKEEKYRVEELIDYQKAKTKEVAEGVVTMLTDPDVQKHFMAVGFEFFMGINALMKAAPLPSVVKDAMNKAEDIKDETSKNFCKVNPNCAKKPKTQKVDITDGDEKPSTKKVKID
ncbi:MAG: hypothetical protein M0Q19_10120 [Candidatus Cloacimonetes bacterium]|nr:hypothetical protein [Candidatus Cloacimonadota bacterium]MDD3379385.1 hypothetical protein [Candidatus Methanomethylophilaceae archaeon]